MNRILRHVFRSLLFVFSSNLLAQIETGTSYVALQYSEAQPTSYQWAFNSVLDFSNTFSRIKGTVKRFDPARMRVVESGPKYDIMRRPIAYEWKFNALYDRSNMTLIIAWNERDPIEEGRPDFVDTFLYIPSQKVWISIHSNTILSEYKSFDLAKKKYYHNKRSGLAKNLTWKEDNSFTKDLWTYYSYWLEHTQPKIVSAIWEKRDDSDIDYYVGYYGRLYATLEIPLKNLLRTEATNLHVIRKHPELFERASKSTASRFITILRYRRDTINELRRQIADIKNNAKTMDLGSIRQDIDRARYDGPDFVYNDEPIIASTINPMIDACIKEIGPTIKERINAKVETFTSVIDTADTKLMALDRMRTAIIVLEELTREHDFFSQYIEGIVDVPRTHRAIIEDHRELFSESVPQISELLQDTRPDKIGSVLDQYLQFIEVESASRKQLKTLQDRLIQKAIQRQDRHVLNYQTQTFADLMRGDRQTLDSRAFRDAIAAYSYYVTNTATEDDHPYKIVEPVLNRTIKTGYQTEYLTYKAEPTKVDLRLWPGYDSKVGASISKLWNANRIKSIPGKERAEDLNLQMVASDVYMVINSTVENRQFLFNKLLQQAN